MEQSKGKNVPGTCSEWRAVHDLMPGGKMTLRVSGVCEFPTPGFTVELKPKVPQGINPLIYLLDRIVTAPTGPVPQVLTKVEVKYEEDTPTRYTHVHIFPDDAKVEVKEVH
jgi:hypothetical protein